MHSSRLKIAIAFQRRWNRRHAQRTSIVDRPHPFTIFRNSARRQITCALTNSTFKISVKRLPSIEKDNVQNLRPWRLRLYLDDVSQHHTNSLIRIRIHQRLSRELSNQSQLCHLVTAMVVGAINCSAIFSNSAKPSLQPITARTWSCNQRR